MAELARALERERNGPLRMMTAAEEAARIERWVKRDTRAKSEAATSDSSASFEVEKPEVTKVQRRPVKSVSVQSLMDQLVDEFRAGIVKTVMETHRCSQTRAAEILGIHRNTVTRIVRAD